MSSSGEEGENGRTKTEQQVNEGQLDAILNNPMVKAALLRKKGLEESENQHPTLSVKNPGVWPPYPPVPFWPNLYQPFPIWPAARRL